MRRSFQTPTLRGRPAAAEVRGGGDKRQLQQVLITGLLLLAVVVDVTPPPPVRVEPLADGRHAATAAQSDVRRAAHRRDAAEKRGALSVAHAGGRGESDGEFQLLPVCMCDDVISFEIQMFLKFIIFQLTPLSARVWSGRGVFKTKGNGCKVYINLNLFSRHPRLAF